MAYLSNVFTFWNFGRTSLYNVTIMVSFISEKFFGLMRLARGSPPLTRISASGAAIRLTFFNALLSKLLAWKRKNPKKRGEGGSISF